MASQTPILCLFGTGLEKMLREQGVTLCAVAGIATNFCVLSTVMDALSHDFKVILLEDCTLLIPSVHKNAGYLSS